MSNVKLACIVGARPNFMKMAPLLRALEAYPNIQPVLIHTGQHYDSALSDVFFADLGMRRPDICLDVGSASHAVQTARVLEGMEEEVARENYNLMIHVMLMPEPGRGLAVPKMIREKMWVAFAWWVICLKIF